MKSPNNRETERLRTTDLMLSYLRDEVPLEDVMQIESLMEEDPLYQLSMESLADKLAENPRLVRMHDQKMQEAFPALLMRAKETFVQQLDPPPKSGRGGGFPSWLGWMLAGVLTLALVWIWWPANRGPVQLHSDPATHLVPEGDVAMLTLFVDQCGEKSPGIGRQEEISVNSAMVEHFAANRFKVAARQLAQLQQQGQLSTECQAMTGFYLGESRLALKAHAPATTAFAAVAANENAPQALRNASYWYLGNLALEARNYDEASRYFSLLEQAETDEQNHLRTLLDQRYLEIANRYLLDLEGS